MLNLRINLDLIIFIMLKTIFSILIIGENLRLIGKLKRVKKLN